MKRLSFLSQLAFLLCSLSVIAQPVADFTYSADCYQFDFTDQSTCNGCIIVGWSWELGPITSNMQNPSVYAPYGQVGSFPVQLIVTADNLLTDTVTLQVDTAGCTPISIELTVDTVGCSLSVTAPPGYTSYQWSNGATTQSIQITSSGTYSLQVTDAIGQIGSEEVEIPSLELEGCAVISGRVFEDLNNNGIDDGEPGLAGVVLRDTVSWQNSTYAISEADGAYDLFVDAFGFHAIDIYSTPSEIVCGAFTYGDQTLPATEAYSINITGGTSSIPGNDFGFNYGDPLGCGTISGNVFEDVNQNGTLELGENGYQGVNIQISNSLGNISTVAQSDLNGNYSVEVPLNETYNISAAVNNQLFYCNYQTINQQTFPTGNQGYSIDLDAANLTSEDNNFGVFYEQGLDAAIFSLWPDYGVNAGLQFSAGMDWKIFGMVNGTCTLRLDFDPLIDFISAGVSPTTIGTDYVEWEFTDPVTPVGGCMPMTFYLDSSAVDGQILNWNATFTCTSTDNCPGSNQLTRISEVITGPMKFQATEFAPVSKISIHTGDQITGNVTHADSTFSYMINFQNITADTARHIRIIDRLSPHLDISTLSQPFSMIPYKLFVLDDQTIVWEFDNVAMPDSGSSFIDSYSFVQYNIRMKQNLPIGTDIFNSAWVYFNREDSIMTNITKNTIVDPDGILDSDEARKHLYLYPNPTTEDFNLQFNSSVSGIYLITVNNVLGQNIYSLSFEHDSETILNIDRSFAPGAYAVSVSNGNDTFIQKLVVQ